MKSQYTKRTDRNKEVINNRMHDDDIFETDNLLERILKEERALESSDDGFDINIIGMSSDDNDISGDSLGDLDDDFDEDMASRLSLYESIDDEEDEIKEFISRDYDVVTESRRRVNQPGKKKHEEDSKKNNKQKDKVKIVKEKKEKKEKEKKEKKEASGFKNLWNKLVNIYNQNTLRVLFDVLAVLTVVLIIVIIIVPKNVDGDGGSKTTAKEATSGVDKSTEKSTTSTSTETSTENQVTMSDLKAEGEDSEIHKLITGFIDAERVQCDIDKAKSYLEVEFDGYSLEQYELLNRYVEGYQDIQCYKFDYVSENMFYVFVSYKMKIKNIETLAEAADTFVVRYNKEQNKYMIVTSYTKEEYAYKVIVENSPEVKLLQSEVLNRQNEALAKDEVLKEFIDIIKGASESTEDVSAETTSTN